MEEKPSHSLVLYQFPPLMHPEFFSFLGGGGEGHALRLYIRRWADKFCLHCNIFIYLFHHHHKHQELDPLIRSISRATTARASASSVFQLFSFLVVCSGMISKGFSFVAFFASVEASSACIFIYFDLFSFH